MSDVQTVSKFLAESVVAATSKDAERSLKELEVEDGFGLTLLQVVSSDNLPNSTRLAGALFFKNFIKRKWVDVDGNYLLPLSNAELIKKEIIPLMIILPANLQKQIGEAISVIADSDFPDRWPSLLNDLASKLSTNDMVTNKGVLTVANSIFKRWRPLFRSDELFTEIKMVLDVFTEPFLNLLKAVDEQIEQNKNNILPLTQLLDVLLLLTKLYYDFNCQDIPEFFEDHVQEGMGILHKYLAYSNSLIEDPEEDNELNVIIKLKSAIQEVVQLYTTRYEDVFGPMVNEFIQVTWSLLTTTTSQPKNDILVSKSLNFLSAVAHIPKYFEIFNSEEAMSNITEQIILPNVMIRETDIELFEDDPIEYIRRDLEGSDADTRRRSCANFIKELKEKNEFFVTNTFINHIKTFYPQYESNPSKNWKYKDLCTYLFTIVAVNGNITSSGVSSTNQLVDVVDFFTKHIISDLTGSVPHPIILVDAIKYIYVFRNQLTKAQLVDIMPILAKLLNSDEYVEYTYAAILIERILSMRESISSSTLIFNKSDLSGSSELLLSNLLSLVLRSNTSPEKLAENEYLMKAVFRVLQTSEDLVQHMFQELMTQLVGIVDIISKNPSNPRFTHYAFESIGAILYHAPAQLIPNLIEIMMPVFMNILTQDIQEFIPYVFQLIAFTIEKISTVPDSVKQLSQPILNPTVWELKGNVPAITRLLKSMIKADASIFQDLVPVLGVFQRLIASKVHDIYGFELLEVIMLNIDTTRLVPFLKQIAVLLLQRLQTSKTEKYVKKLVVFLGMLAIKLGPDFPISFIDDVQDGIFVQIWNNFVIPTIPKFGNLQERKVAIIGAITILRSNLVSTKYSTIIPGTVTSIIDATLSESIANLKTDHIDLDNLEEISTFGSSFSKLFSISEKPFDPLPEINPVQGVKPFVSKALMEYIQLSATQFSNTIVPQLSNETQSKLNELVKN
ncbi:hypothetical protein TPHA_0N01280 [Tetrapisispora phaffii CBS 4417]|uniref:Importin N-terminal domain-containing protein n=1 Tax=Tetrapisispora phaffii (strain ATCC 24235 / CBS 4417 / NBRC 1672 / NRRL Y-8282 / UCD 70-5) TaxID=1071381 RepID=G8C181_TETPH|nr:hypothetical protein TPHA_0N01280 [Tetrapisispora phaffii CBS 4417]CCE65909.1 hypothetical protein TPHA_0N01280 [Tetrapisispora phaffii CBS 4417]